MLKNYMLKKRRVLTLGVLKKQALSGIAAPLFAVLWPLSRNFLPDDQTHAVPSWCTARHVN